MTTTMTSIQHLRAFAENDLHNTDLRGYAARDAVRTLLPNWESAMEDGNTDNLVQDIDLVIAYLQTFRSEAQLLLPVVNGGLEGRSDDRWEQILLVDFSST